jgi:hypothetical protein
MLSPVWESARAREALERSQYAGPAPVPLSVYNDACRRQARGRMTVTNRLMRQVLSSMVLSEKALPDARPCGEFRHIHLPLRPSWQREDQYCPAIGNLIMTQNIYIPYSIYVDGQVIKMYDTVNHQLATEPDATAQGTGSLRSGARRDPRWVRIRRPFIATGGELTWLVWTWYLMIPQVL